MWTADPRRAWQNLLVAEVTDRPTPALLQERLNEANQDLGSGGMRILHHRKLVSMQAELASARSGSAVSAGLTYDRVVLAAHHRLVDGAGLLALLSRLTGHPLTVRPETLPSHTGTAVDEAAPRTPARVAPAHYRDDLLSDVFAAIHVARPVRLTHLLVAACGATQRYNARRATSSEHIQVTVNGSTVGEGAPRLGTTSALVHLPDVEAASSGAFARMLRDGSQHPADDLATARTQGSTLLVADLGTVVAPHQVRRLQFYPSAGATFGVALGATTEDDRTNITARASGSRHTEAGMREFLELLRNELA